MVRREFGLSMAEWDRTPGYEQQMLLEELQREREDQERAASGEGPASISPDDDDPGKLAAAGFNVR